MNLRVNTRERGTGPTRQHGAARMRQHGGEPVARRTTEHRSGRRPARPVAERPRLAKRAATLTEHVGAGRVPPERPAARTNSTPPPHSISITLRPGQMRRRLRLVFLATMIVFVMVIGRVFYLQTTGSDSLKAAGKAQRVFTTVLPAQRGTIFASDGSELALSVPSSTIYANPKDVVDPSGVVSVLGSMLSLSPDKQQSLLESFTAKTKSFVYVARQVDDEIAKAVMALDLAGIDTISEAKRAMPSGDVGRSVVGRTDVDGVGIAGLEKQYDELLTGKNGERVREVDRNGHTIAGTGATSVDPIAGDDLVLTIDRSLQFQIEEALVARVEALKANGGSVVVIDTDTGDIKAMANVKRAAPTVVGTIEVPGPVEVTGGNLAAVDAFEPGSVAKVFSIAAVVDQGAGVPSSKIEVPGKVVFDPGTGYEKTINDAEKHDTEEMTLREILVHSSNVGTLLFADKIGNEALDSYLKGFGFGTKSALDFPDESAGIMKPWQDLVGSEKATVSYGYGYSATAVQLAAAVNTVANGGVYVAPRLLAATIDANGHIDESAPSESHRVLKESTAQMMTGMMTGVVCEGTGTGAWLPNIAVAGKTGTAYKLAEGGGYGEDGNRSYRATFVGFFPATAPKVTILVTIDEPDPTSRDRFGGTAAAPLFKTIATSAIHELFITPTPGESVCTPVK